MLAYIIAGLFAIGMALLLYHRTSPGLAKEQRIALTALRAVAWSLLLLFLITPIISYIRKYREQPEIILLKDTSASMGLRHNDASKSDRLSPPYSKLKSAYAEAGYKVKELAFADGLGGKPGNTFFLPALEKIKQDTGKTPLNGIVLFSDGWFRDTDMRLLKGYGVPISTVADTAQFVASDLLINDFRHNRQGYRNELSLFEADVKASNYTGSAVVSFLVNGKMIKQKSVNFKTEPTQVVTFDNRFAQTGLQKLEVKIAAPGLNEITQSNNNYLSAIDILNDKEKILLFTDAPNWDTKFILDTIRDNNRLEAVSYTITGGVLYQGDQPATIKSWDNINCVVIVNQGNLQLTNALGTGITSLVKKGTGLFWMGQPVQQLAEVLPIRMDNIRNSYKGLFRLLPAAGVYPAFSISNDELAQIPPVDYYYLSSNTTAEVLAVMDNTQKSPAIVVSSAAGGKVAAFTFLNLWRWQMQSHSQAYKSFTADVLTWLSNRSAGALTALYKPGYFLDEPVSIRLSATDDVRRNRQDLSPRLFVYNAKNDSVYSDFLQQDKEGYGIQFRLDKPDAYWFRIVDLTTNQSTTGRFMVSTDNLEARDLGYNLPLLSWVSSQTGGRFTNADEALNYKPVKASRQDRIEKKEFPLYKKWYLICLFIIVFCLELYFRRRWGLL
jgi:hypothetical protein